MLEGIDLVFSVGFMLILLFVSLFILRFYNGKTFTSNYSYRFLKWIDEVSKKIQ